ncbi:MAG: hypothetical protein FJ090_18110 [Deltaproteobacteria bacterium]|nr:hypothetical protein [Deltaproteobacteria bacterium]
MTLPRDPRLLTVPAGALAGLLVGEGADGERATMLLLLLEPLGWVVAAWAGYAAWVRRDAMLIVVVLLTMASVSIAVRLPRPGPEPGGEPPVVAARLAECARGLALPEGPVRLVQWHLGDDAGLDAADKILAVEPDVVVIVGPAASAVVERVQDGLGGESKRVDTPEGPVTILARGVFHACGDGDAWTDAPVDGAATVIAFVGVAPGITVPLLLARLPSPLGPVGWDARAARARARLRATVDALASSLAVVLVDGVLPSPARRLEAGMRAAQLDPVRSAPTWPSHALVPPLLPFDRAWYAGAWNLSGVATLDTSGARRLGLAVALEPSVPLAPPDATGSPGAPPPR